VTVLTRVLGHTTSTYAAVPVKRNAGVYYWALEKKSKMNRYRFDGL
jgi:hypothetical protein